MAVDGLGFEWETFQILDDSSEDVGEYTSLIEIDGTPAISYYDAECGKLKYVRYIGE